MPSEITITLSRKEDKAILLCDNCSDVTDYEWLEVLPDGTINRCEWIDGAGELIEESIDIATWLLEQSQRLEEDKD